MTNHVKRSSLLIVLLVVAVIFSFIFLIPHSLAKVMEFPVQPLYVLIEQAGTQDAVRKSVTLWETGALNNIRQALIDTEVRFLGLNYSGELTTFDSTKGISGDAFFFSAAWLTGPDSLEETEKVFLRYDGYVVVGCTGGGTQYQICNQDDMKRLLRLIRTTFEAS